MGAHQMIEDTRDARRACVSTSALSLEYMGSIFTDYHAWKMYEREEGDGKVVFTKNLKRKKRYNCHDCVVTSRSWRGIKAEPEWKEQRTLDLYAHQTQLSIIAAKMRDNGVKVDPVARQFLAWGLEKQYDSFDRKVCKAVDIDGFKCTPNHLRAIIYKKHATGKYAHLAKFQLPDPLDPEMYVNPKEWETSALSVKEDALALLVLDPSTPDELKRIVSMYWDAETTWKMRSTMVVSKLIDHAIGPDGRIRAGWNSCGTDTGRFSCSDPNLMTVKEWLRAMYVAEPGWTLVGADYSQLELRVMAAIAQDTALATALATGDVYTAEAIEYFNLPADTTKKTIKKPARDSAKTIRLARQYGAGKKTVFRNGVLRDHKINLDFTWDRVIPLMNAFDRRNWRTVAYWDEETARVMKCGYSETRIMHRRRVYPAPPERTDTSNYPIQGTAADIKNLALIDLDRRLSKEVPEARILIDLHDAIYAEAPTPKAEKVKKIMQECMEVDHLIDGKKYSFPVKIGIGQTWADF